MSYGYIYKTTNLINGRLYIGQRKGTFTPDYLGSGKIIKIAIKQYGKNNFRLEVLAFATTYQMLNGLEMKYIYEYRQVFGDRFLYNITDGGRGPQGNKHTQEVKNKIGLASKGRVFSEEHKKKISLSEKGKFVSEETKRKLSLSHIGLVYPKRKFRPLTQEHKDKVKQSMLKYFSQKKKNDTQATGSNIVPPLIGAQNRLQEKAVKVS